MTPAQKWAYQKSRWDHWGVALPKMDDAIKETFGGLSQEQALDLCRRLWREPVWDLRIVAGRILARKSIAPDAKTTWASADLLLKVKEPIASEYIHFRDDLLLFTYLHLAAEPELTKALLDAKVTAIAYETVTSAAGGLPPGRPPPADFRRAGRHGS